jgi:hypothetical protein
MDWQQSMATIKRSLFLHRLSGASTTFSYRMDKISFRKEVDSCTQFEFPNGHQQLGDIPNMRLQNGLNCSDKKLRI